MEANNKLTEALETQDIETLKKLSASGIDLSNIDLCELIKPGCNIEFLQFIIDQGVDVKQLNKENKSALLFAIKLKNKKIVELLIKNGVDVNIGIDSISTLMGAISLESQEIAELLIKNGADVNVQSEGNITALILAVMSGNIELVKLLIENGADVNIKGDKEQTTLIYAVLEGNKKIVELLILNGVEVDAKDNNGVTALMFMCNSNNTDIAELLINNGADINILGPNGYTALMIASELGHKDIVQLLIDNNVDLDAMNKDGVTALSKAIAHNHKKIVKLLLDNGANAKIEFKKENLLMVASERSSKYIVKLLIGKGIDINAQDKKGITALMNAAIHGNENIVKYLIKKGADINIKRKTGSTVLLSAAITGNIELVKFLMQNGADITYIDNDGNSIILQLVVGSLMTNQEILEQFNVRKSISEYKKDILKVIKLLLNAGANINVVNKEDYTALMFAVLYQDIEMVKLFLKKGANVNYKNNDGISVLNMSFYPSDSMNYLMTQSIQIKKMQNESRLPLNFDSLHQKGKSLEIAKLLIKHGAILEKFKAWTLVIPQKDLELIKLVIDNSNTDDFTTYMNSLIIYSSYNLQEISTKSVKSFSLKEFHGQMFKGMSLEIYLKVFELLIDAGIDLNAKNEYGHTALISAIIHNNIAMVEILLEEDLDPEIKSKRGFKAIDYTVNNKDIRTLLLKKGVKLNKEKIDKKSLKKIQKEITKTIQKESNMDDIDWEKDEKNVFSGGTVLSSALKSKKVKDLQIAISNKAILNTIDIVNLVKDGYSAKYIDMALKNAANKNRQDLKGKTALMYACELGKTKIVKVLIKNSVDMTIVDNEGNDVWYYASGKEKIHDLLINYDEISAPNHNPKKLVKILTNFTKETPIKYTTHDWDFGNITNSEHKNFKGFISAIQELWGKFEEDLNELSPSLHTKINTFLLSDNEDTMSWCEKEEISIGWSSIKGLEAWCDEGKDPYKFKLKKSYIIDDKEISTFGKVIELFKQEIENRKEHHMLKKCFINIGKSLDKPFTITYENFREAKFYTDITNFQRALQKNIFTEIQKREDFPNIKVSAINDTDGQYIDIVIVQIGAVSQQSSDGMLAAVEGGNFKNIKKLLTNLCDWSIESSFDEENYRVNYLRSNKNIPEIESLDYKPEGFTYKMRFYKA